MLEEPFGILRPDLGLAMWKASDHPQPSISVAPLSVLTEERQQLCPAQLFVLAIAV